jgi:hypothetical protein
MGTEPMHAIALLRGVGARLVFNVILALPWIQQSHHHDIESKTATTKLSATDMRLCTAAAVSAKHNAQY